MSSWGRVALSACLILAMFSLVDPALQAQQLPPAGGPAQILTAADVTAVITAAAGATNGNGMAIAVTDRVGTILGVYTRPGTGPRTPDIAVTLARTTSFFSNDRAPLSSRTVRFISGIHFPPSVPNLPNNGLYGVENINRGCNLGTTFDAQGLAVLITFNAGKFSPRAHSIAGTNFGPALPGLPCNPGNTAGCAVGGPIKGLDGIDIFSFGVTTGKPNLLDQPNSFPPSGGGYVGVNPGGISLYRNRQLIGGIGVAGVPLEQAEYAALVGAAAQGAGITAAIDFPNPLPIPGAIYIDGARLPFYGNCGTFLSCIEEAARNPPAGTIPGSFNQGSIIRGPLNGQQAPEFYLIGPKASTVAGGLTEAEVRQIVANAVVTADVTRAQVRLPYGQTAKVIIVVTDEIGDILAEYRMSDGLFDAVDVVPSKARNAYYFSTREGYEVLRDEVNESPEGYQWTPEPPAGQGWALTSRTLGFGGQPLFPPGIDLEKPPEPGPWFELFVYDTLNPCTEGPGPSRGGDRTFPNQNGITWFPGSAPLYKDGRLVGGLGVSGDGLFENDFITAGGAAGFEPPPGLRVDNSVIITREGGRIRLPYLKFPRNPRRR